jgi:D-glycero-D-manno-heptose 1,7-bisphosphate phosphatase
MGICEVIKPKNRAVFFDRDGVLNHAIVREGKPYPPSTIEELRIDEDAPESLDRLLKEAFVLIGITNQPDVARGTQVREVVESINTAIRKVLPLADIRVCYHDDASHCTCRKPQPGLLLEASKDYNIDLTSSFMIGDRWKDIEAGRRAGCHTIWINRGYTEKQPGTEDAVAVSSLKEAVDYIINMHCIERR